MKINGGDGFLKNKVTLKYGEIFRNTASTNWYIWNDKDLSHLDK